MHYRINSYLLLSLLCLGGLITNGQEQPKFSRLIVGQVKDRDGHPVTEARICAQPQMAWEGLIPCSTSKQDGRFAFSVWHGGTYVISAESQENSYPHAYLGFYGRFFGEFPTINVHESNELQPVEIIVGPKAGRVIFRITDAESGKLIERGAVVACRKDDPQMCFFMNGWFLKGKFELLTPEVPFTIKFRVRNGEVWEERYVVDENNKQVETLQVELGDEREINIKLKRDKDAALNNSLQPERE